MISYCPIKNELQELWPPADSPASRVGGRAVENPMRAGNASRARPSRMTDHPAVGLRAARRISHRVVYKSIIGGLCAAKGRRRFCHERASFLEVC